MAERKFTKIGKDGIECDKPCFSEYIYSRPITYINGRHVCSAHNAPVIEGKGRTVIDSTFLTDMRDCIVHKREASQSSEKA